MPDFAALIAQGSAHAWLFVPSAILLGALHGLEPGHSKTMMAAFIVAIRGTVRQAILLGIAATISHTAIVWGIALGGMYLWRGLDAEAVEPWFQLLSGLIIIAVAAWMFWRTYADQRSFLEMTAHAHAAEARRVDTGHGMVELSIFGEGVPPRWRFRTLSGHRWPAQDVSVTLRRADGQTQRFAFAERAGQIESVDTIPEPHEFAARLSLGRAGHSHDYDLDFREHSHAAIEAGDNGYEGAHQRAHANDIRRRFTSGTVTNWQIMIFGLTGGLIPCPAAITVLLLCLQLKEVTLGAVLVLCFSIGLAITLVTVGAVAALSVRHAGTRFPWLSKLAQRAPYVSALLIFAVGIYVAWHGLSGLEAG